MGEEVVDLAGPDVFTGEHYVAAAVDYQGWVGGDVSEVVGRGGGGDGFESGATTVQSFWAAACCGVGW